RKPARGKATPAYKPSSLLCRAWRGRCLIKDSDAVDDGEGWMATKGALWWNHSKALATLMETTSSELHTISEQASTSNGGNPVIIVSHSLGCLFTLQQLTRRLPSWRQKYVKHFIALSAPWGGTVQEMATFASGYTFGVPIVNPLLVRQEQRSSESNLWLMPSPKVFRGTNPLVITSNATYTAKDIAKFLADIGFSEGMDFYKTRNVPLTYRFEAPNVPITCVIGSGIRTPETLFYGDKGFG
ncbi:Lecithin-cholesterol acyltransferase-like 1-like protein, partial [Drosera capensis]